MTMNGAVVNWRKANKSWVNHAVKVYETEAVKLTAMCYQLPCSLYSLLDLSIVTLTRATCTLS